MNVLLVTPNYPPEIGSSAQIYASAAREFAVRGHRVDVLTSSPRRFNVASAEAPLETQGITIHRVRHLAGRDSALARGLEHFLLPRLYARHAKKLGLRPDLAILHVPPLALAILGYRFQRMGTISILNVQDFHPEELADVGYIKNRLIIAMLERYARRCYQKAKAISVLSPGGVAYLVRKGAHPARVRCIYNAYDPPLQQVDAIPGPPYIVSYAGILSPFQGLDQILDAAIRLRDSADIQFIIAGQGMEEDRLRKRITEERIHNVALKPYLSPHDYEKLVRSSTVSLVTLDHRMNAPIIPGKVPRLMALGSLVVAAVKPGSETWKLLEKHHLGLLCAANQPDDLAAMVQHAVRHPALAARIRQNALDFANREMSAKALVDAYEAFYEDLRTAKATVHVQEKSKTASSVDAEG